MLIVSALKAQVQTNCNFMTNDDLQMKSDMTAKNSNEKHLKMIT